MTKKKPAKKPAKATKAAKPAKKKPTTPAKKAPKKKAKKAKPTTPAPAKKAPKKKKAKPAKKVAAKSSANAPTAAELLERLDDKSKLFILRELKANRASNVALLLGEAFDLQPSVAARLTNSIAFRAKRDGGL